MKSALLILLAAVSARGTTYYVDYSSGSDANSGTSPGQAWQNLAKIQSSSFAPGDRILFKRGDVWRGQSLKFPSSGSAGNPIVIDAYGTGAPPIIDGSVVVTGWIRDVNSSRWYTTSWKQTTFQVFIDNNYLKRAASLPSMSVGSYFHDEESSRLYVRTPNDTTPVDNLVEASVAPAKYYGLFYFVNKSYITVQKLTFRKANQNAIKLHQSASNITIDWCAFDRNYQTAVQMQGGLGEAAPSNVHVWHSTFTMNGIARGYMQTGESEAVAINIQGLQSGSAKWNTIRDQGGEGIQVMAGAKNVEVSDNTIANTHGPGIYLLAGWGNCGDTTNVTATRNTIIAGSEVSRSTTLSAIGTEPCTSDFVRQSGNTLASTAPTFRMGPGYQITFKSTGALPAGLSSGVTYYVMNPSGSTFQVSKTRGGSPVTITSAGLGRHSLVTSANITDLVFAHNILRGSPETNGILLLFGSGVYSGVIRRTTIHHNIFYNGYYGVQSRGPTDDDSNVFSNNTFVLKDWGRAYSILPPVNASLSNPSDNYRSIDYDVFYNRSGTVNRFAVEWQGNVCSGNNLCTLEQWRAATGNGVHSAIREPMFRDPENGDFSLRRASPPMPPQSPQRRFNIFPPASTATLFVHGR